MLKDLWTMLFYMAADRDAGGNYYGFDEFVRNSSGILLGVALVGLLALIIINPDLRNRRRTEDRIMFWNCMILFGAIALELLYRYHFNLFGRYILWFSVYAKPLKDMLYMMVVLQWLIFVDFSLFHSLDHIKRRYKFSAIPIFVIVIVDIFQNRYIFTSGDESLTMLRIYYITHFAKTVLELIYILIAVHLAISYAREHNEPGFLRMSAFIVPFIIGCVFKKYDLSLMALGIILTYMTVKKRDRYIDRETGFFNSTFLEYISSYRDHNSLIDDDGILIDAKGHGKYMSELLDEIRPGDSKVFALGEERFLLLSESLRESAMEMVVNVITEYTKAGADGFAPLITTYNRRSDETAGEFAGRIMSACRA